MRKPEVFHNKIPELLTALSVEKKNKKKGVILGIGRTEIML